MWTSRDISLDIEIVDGDEVIVVLATPAGIVRIAGERRFRQRVLYVNRVHIEDFKSGALGCAGLECFSPTTLVILFDFAHDLVRKVCNSSGSCANGIGRKLLEKPMLTKLSLKEALERQGVTQEGPPNVLLSQ